MTAIDSEMPELSPQETVDRLLQRLAAGSADLSADATTRDLICTGRDASRLIREAGTLDADGDAEIRWAGTAVGSMSVPLSVSLGSGLAITGRVEGDLQIWGSVGGDLAIDGEAVVTGSLRILGVVDGDTHLSGHIGGDVTLGSDGKQARIAGLIGVGGQIDGSLVLDSSVVEGLFAHVGKVGGDLIVLQGANIEGDLEVSGAVGGRLAVFGSVEGELIAFGEVDRETSLLPSVESQLIVRTFSIRTQSTIFFGPNVDLSDANFRGFAAFNQLRFHGDRPFAAEPLGRQSLSESSGAPAAEQAALYRQLRRSFEANSNRPAASDFYFGETESRRIAIAERRAKWRSAEWWVLSTYKALSAYGTRSLRTVGWFAAIAVASSALFAINGVNLTDTYNLNIAEFKDSAWGWSERATLLLFTVRSMVSFFSPPEGSLTTAEGYLQIALRFVGPLLIAQTALAIRDRVAR